MAETILGGSGRGAEYPAVMAGLDSAIQLWAPGAGGTAVYMALPPLRPGGSIRGEKAMRAMPDWQWAARTLPCQPKAGGKRALT